MRAPLLTAADAAEYLRRTPRWVTDAARSGVIPARKVGASWRFTEGDLDAYLDAARNVEPTVIRRRRAS